MLLALIVGQGDKDLVEVTVDTDGDAGDDTGTVIATDGHPFWVENLGAWIDAKDLRPGDMLRTSAGTWVQVQAVHEFQQHQRVHNLTVADIHTYHVTTTNTDLLVHNTSCPNNLQPGNSPAAQLGTRTHNDPAITDAFDAMGYRRGPGYGKNQPDFETPNGDPVELKPHTRSGVRKGTRQLRRYLRSSGSSYGELWTYAYQGNLLILRKVAVPSAGRRWQWFERP